MENAIHSDHHLISLSLQRFSPVDDASLFVLGSTGGENDEKLSVTTVGKASECFVSCVKRFSLDRAFIIIISFGNDRSNRDHYANYQLITAGQANCSDNDVTYERSLCSKKKTFAQPNSSKLV